MYGDIIIGFLSLIIIFYVMYECWRKINLRQRGTAQRYRRNFIYFPPRTNPRYVENNYAYGSPVRQRENRINVLLSSNVSNMPNISNRSNISNNMPVSNPNMLPNMLPNTNHFSHNRSPSHESDSLDSSNSHGSNISIGDGYVTFTLENMIERECPICLEEMDIGHRIAALECMHTYHPECIDEWFSYNRICPECKYSF